MTTIQPIEERLNAAKQIAQEAEKKRIQLETKLEATQARKQELLDKCAQLGIQPEQLESKILELNTKIESGMKELDKILPSDDAPTQDDLPY